tara:strand:+ start:1829 stop:2569 length:741 start_codon:yes stop_codon:yes gene_type:complete
MQITIDKLQTLKLLGFIEALKSLDAQPESDRLTFEERLSILVDREITYRENRRQKRLLRIAKLRDSQACVEHIDYEHSRSLDRNLMLNLNQCDWVRKQQNVVFIGPTGVGKTYLACALGEQACRQGLVVKYIRLPRLFEELQMAHGEGTYSRFMSQTAKTDLLILDDWGIGELNKINRQELLEILEERHGIKSTVITTQLPVKHWHEYIGDATIADAMIDRLLSCAHVIQLDGDSLRKKLTNVDPK